MQLHQTRGFNDFFQDTFAFIKQNGKHYFKHYFIINGFFLVLLATISYLFFSFFSSVIFNPLALGGIGNNTVNPLDDFMNENLGLFVLFLIAFFVIALLAGIINYAYTPIYLKLYNENNGVNFSTKEIVNSYKANIGKLVVFVLLGLLIGFPLIIAAGLVSLILMITIVGILLLPLVLGLLTLIYNSTLLEYLHNKRDFWASMGYTWNLITSKFWATVGCVGIFFLISYIIQFIIQITSSIFMTARTLTVSENGSTNPFDMPTSVIIVMALMFILQFLASILMNSVIQVNQGIIYFSLKEEKENINTKSAIDQIGSGEN